MVSLQSNVYTSPLDIPYFGVTSSTQVDDPVVKRGFELKEAISQWLSDASHAPLVQAVPSTTGVVYTRQLRRMTLTELWSWLVLPDSLMLQRLPYTIKRACPHCQGRFLSERIRPVLGMTTYCQQCRTRIKPIEQLYYHELATSQPDVALTRHRQRLLIQLQKGLVR